MKKIPKENVTNQFRKNKKLIAVLLAIGTAILFYIVFGAVTAIIPNKFFTRMTPFRIVGGDFVGRYFSSSWSIYQSCILWKSNRKKQSLQRNSDSRGSFWISDIRMLYMQQNFSILSRSCRGFCVF